MELRRVRQDLAMLVIMDQLLVSAQSLSPSPSQSLDVSLHCISTIFIFQLFAVVYNYLET